MLITVVKVVLLFKTAWNRIVYRLLKNNGLKKNNFFKNINIIALKPIHFKVEGEASSQVQ